MTLGISGRAMMSAMIQKELGGPGQTAQKRLEAAMLARRCRNFFFSALAPVIAAPPAGTTPTIAVNLQAQTAPFGMPILITDIINYAEDTFNGVYWGRPNQLVQLFTNIDAGREDFFGSASMTDAVQTFSHERNLAAFTIPPNSFPNIDLEEPSHKIEFAPYIMKVGQIFTVNWFVPAFAGGWDFNPELDFRGLTVLGANDTYGQLCGRLKEQVCGYIKAQEPQSFIMDLTIPSTTFAAGTPQTVDFPTQPQERPLLIYGIGSNISGVQVTLRDQATKWEFCAPGQQPATTVSGGLAVGYGGPRMAGMPLCAIAANPEETNRDAYNIFPVPHLLEPNSSLIFRLSQGLRPRGLSNAFQQNFNTTGMYDNGDGIGRISLLCRTV